MEKPERSSKCRLVVGLLALLGLVLMTTGPALGFGAQRYWSSYAVDSWWNNPENWSTSTGTLGGAGIPQYHDYVYLYNDKSTNKTVKYYNPPGNTQNNTFFELGINAWRAGDMMLWCALDHPLYTQKMTIGLATNIKLAPGANPLSILQQDAGTVQVGEYYDIIDYNTHQVIKEFVGGSLILGSNEGYLNENYGRSNGIYRLTGGTLKAKEEIVGDYGNGAILQEGGFNDTRTAIYYTPSQYYVQGQIVLGRQTTGNGIYELKGGTTRTIGLIVGEKGIGTFRQTGGFLEAADLYFAHEVGGTGTFELKSTGNLRCGQQYIGYKGIGIFNQTGGINRVDQPIGEGYESPIPEFLELGTHLGSQGTYNLSGGQLIAPKEIIGRFGLGTFEHTGGTNKVENFVLGAGITFPGIGGIYKLSGTGSLKVSSDAIIGDNGIGVFEQTGGVHEIQKNLYLAFKGAQVGPVFLGSQGTYKLSSGNLTVLGNEYIGYSGIGKFTQDGGNNVVFGKLELGCTVPLVDGPPPSHGTYELNAGLLMALGGQYIGSAGKGTFTQKGGINDATSLLEIGYLGTYNLEGGTLFANKVDVKSGGTFNKTGSDFSIGDLANAGTINLAGTGLTEVRGNTENQEGGKLNISQNPVVFRGTVVNYGTLQVTGTTATFMGDLDIRSSGSLIGDQESCWLISNDLIDRGFQGMSWNTRTALLRFISGEDNIHRLYLGRTASSQTWGTLDITGQTLFLEKEYSASGDYFDGIPGMGMASLVFGEILGLEFSDSDMVIKNLMGCGFDIFYDPNLPGNRYLAGLTYTLKGGGRMLPTPLPPTWLLLASGMAGLLSLGVRRKKN
jgi:hypothetical protein